MDHRQSITIRGHQIELYKLKNGMWTIFVAPFGGQWEEMFTGYLDEEAVKSMMQSYVDMIKLFTKPCKENPVFA